MRTHKKGYTQIFCDDQLKKGGPPQITFSLPYHKHVITISQPYHSHVIAIPKHYTTIAIPKPYHMCAIWHTYGTLMAWL